MIPEVGKYYLVDCWVEPNEKWEPEYEVGREGDQVISNLDDLESVWPIINHIHNDKENGQEDPHYHVDDRFETRARVPYTRIYPDYREVEGKVEKRRLKAIANTVMSITPIDLIEKSKLKHKCMHKGKCPHRGYDLSNETPMNGIITCPLHGLKFKEKSGELINEPKKIKLETKIEGYAFAVSKGPESRDDEMYLNYLNAFKEVALQAKDEYNDLYQKALKLKDMYGITIEI